MSQESQLTPPPIIWAQRHNLVYVTICLEDCKDAQVDVEEEKIYFKGVGGTEKKMHELTINLYKSIDVGKTVKSPTDRVYELVLYKKELGPYWPRLTKEDKKFHWLKSDFNKWKDEDESDDSDENRNGPLSAANYPQLMQNLGFGDAEKPKFDDLYDEQSSQDSDDDEMPYLV